MVVEADAMEAVHVDDRTTLGDVIGNRVCCPACEEHVFLRWPLGWDAHAHHRCSNLAEIAECDRKSVFKARFRHLFRA